MQELLESLRGAHSHSRCRPILDSYDSGEEFSFFRWIEVCKLVDEGDVQSNAPEPPYAAEYEALRKMLSEVESATAYQDFARNIV